MQINYKEFYKLVCKYYSSVEDFSFAQWDETFFTMRVFETAKELIRKLKMDVDVDVILTAALFHDIGKTALTTEERLNNDWENHPKYSGEMTEKILADLKFDAIFIDKVVDLVKKHNFRPNVVKIERSNELKILQDADLLADMGIANFIRPFLYGAKYKRAIIDTIKYIKNNMGKRSLLREKIGKLNFDLSKKMVRKLISESDELFVKIIQLTNSELLDV